ncbi:hypothetical protein ACJQWK_06029 [Exserohilum turcicum]
MNTLQRRRSMSHAAAAFTDETADKIPGQRLASHAPPPPPQRATTAFCRHCSRQIGDFYNSWYRVTGSYYAPALLGSYSFSLKRSAKPKAASKGTDLEDCTIQPLSCPHPGCGDTPIGFTVVTAPPGKGKFRGRDFFKLSRIELRCEIAPGQFIVIEPREDTAPDLSAPEDSPSPSSLNHTPKPSSTSEAMEVVSATPSLHQSAYSRAQLGKPYEPDHTPRPSLYPIDADRQSFKTLPSIHSPPVLSPLQSTARIALGQTPSCSPPAPESRRESLAPPHQDPAVSPKDASRVLPQPAMPRSRSFPEITQTVVAHHYPRAPSTVGIDAVERLQTQISQNSGALAAHTRDIRRCEESFLHLEDTLRREFQTQLSRHSVEMHRVEESVARLQHDMQAMRYAMESLTRDLKAARMNKEPHTAAFAPRLPSGAQDSAIELMAQQIAAMSHKTSEVDNMKLHMEIMKNKIYQLEEKATAAQSQPPPHAHQTPREPPVQPAQTPHSAALSYHTTPTLSHSEPSQPVSSAPHHQLSLGAPPLKTVSEATPRTEPGAAQSNGWAAINAGVKRTSHSSMDSPKETASYGPHSPKRQKLGEPEPYPSNGYTASHPPVNRAEADRADARFSTPARAMPSPSTVPESIVVSQPQQVVYATRPQDGPVDDVWRSTQQPIGYRPRGRGRGGGGPGSRGGRVQKSMMGSGHAPYGASDWETESIPGSQASPEDLQRRGSIARRGNGGSGGRGGFTPNDRAASLGLQGVTAGVNFGPAGETYGSTKKTRTKPVRNADGILIRKDGRPDMRSQSSAANLRKVHARKEGESSHSPTPTASLQYAASAGAPDTPSPSAFTPTNSNATDKHNAIMGKIFPAGLDASRKQHDYVRQVFSEDDDHAAHSRSHNHRKPSSQVKKEQVEGDAQSSSGSHSAASSPQQQHDGDTDRDDDDDDEATDDASQTSEEPKTKQMGVDSPQGPREDSERPASRMRDQPTTPATQPAADGDTTMTELETETEDAESTIVVTTTTATTAVSAPAQTQ